MNFGLGSMIEHPSFGEGVIFGITSDFYRIYFRDHGEKELAKGFDGYELIEEGEVLDSSIELDDVVQAVSEVFEQYMEKEGVVELGDRWDGGALILNPGREGLQPKEIPIETFFHKIVMVRDRLRVLEQNINSNKKLSDEDKVNLQQYITRIYGSLTTFNVLFESRDDWFVGESGKG